MSVSSMEGMVGIIVVRTALLAQEDQPVMDSSVSSCAVYRMWYAILT